MQAAFLKGVDPASSNARSAFSAVQRTPEAAANGLAYFSGTSSTPKHGFIRFEVQDNKYNCFGSSISANGGSSSTVSITILKRFDFFFAKHSDFTVASQRERIDEMI